jgi:hypothetical protein
MIIRLFLLKIMTIMTTYTSIDSAKTQLDIKERFLNLLKTYSFYVRVAEPGQMRRT